MKDEKSSLNCKRKKHIFSRMVYHIQNDCLKIYLTNILITSANLETAWPYFWGSTFKIGAIFAWWSSTPYSDWKHEMNIFKDLCVTLLNLKKWGLSNFAFQSFKGFIDTLNKKKILIPMRDFWKNPIYPLLSTWISAWTEPETNFG